MKLIACIPLKNEAWVIKYTLSALSEFVDEIIALDDGSSDDSIKILESYPKVTQIIKNKPRSDKFRNEPLNWNRLTKAAIERGADWIFYTDADEMVEPRIKDEIRVMMEAKDVDVYQFKKISPWRGYDFYRSESDKWVSPAKNVLNPILIRATERLTWPNPKGDFKKRIAKLILRGEPLRPTIGRNFPLGLKGKVVERNDLMSVHFNNISYDSLIKKQINYAINEKIEKPYKTNQQIIDWVFFRLDEAGMELTPVNQDWYWKDYLKQIEL
ncbi:glycosyltransferase family 2 protein [Pedobacter sp. Leaf176]|uniref:glycosyltransferase family 2 protein n=1 Tax=Pedobacter sp. Leaf176 TaxID=1736286 RepID=UPI0006FAFABE|nr:glycosyltransferase family 2 protein [Pedobacter sp. Leaf176]KQR72130.1 hypothetical protein ASF92_02160 [Pedobacter sp. Leaf176]